MVNLVFVTREVLRCTIFGQMSVKNLKYMYFVEQEKITSCHIIVCVPFLRQCSGRREVLKHSQGVVSGEAHPPLDVTQQWR